MKVRTRIKALCVTMLAACGVALLCMGASTAFADSLSTDGYVTAASTRAATPAPEILGLSGVEDNGSFSDQSKLLTWSSPKFYLLGTTDYNANPNPYFYNALYGGSPAYVYNASRAGTSKVGKGPAAPLAAYGVDSTDDEVWNLLPDVVIGKGSDVDYTSAAYAPAVAAANNTTYNPIGIDYLFTNNTAMINTMYNIANAADQVVANNSNKKLRYGSALAIAENYEKYVRGTQGYILKQLSDNSVSKKTVAEVQSYNTDTQLYTLITSGAAEGTASTNRYLEAVEQVSNNLATTLGTTTATADQLKTADLIMVGGLAGSSGEGYTSVADITGTFDSAMMAKSFYVTGSGSAGSMYGVVMNSVENAQNIGRILGCLYPEYVDQDDWMCYYYDVFYHVKAAQLGTALDNAMDGVRNWDASSSSSTSDATLWSTSDATTYNKSDVQTKIEAGITYLQGLGSNCPTVLQPSDYLTKTSIATATVTLDQTGATGTDTWAWTGSAINPAVTVKLGTTTLTPDTDYTVTITNNTDAGVATVTVSGAGSNYTGTAVKTFTIAAASKTDISKATVSAIADQTYTGSAIEPAVTVKLGDATLAAGTDYTVTYADNTAVGTATVTITGTGSYTGTVTPKPTFKIASACNDFTDVKSDVATNGFDNVWYVHDGWLDYVVANGLMSGYSDGSNNFGPVDYITRGQVATILYRYECSKDSTLEDTYGSTYNTGGKKYATTAVFKDEATNAYYTAAINWAKAVGIMTGDSSTGYTTVRPDDNVQRQELCVMLARFAQKVEGASASEGSVDYSAIRGMDKVDSWASDGVKWCASYGIIGGVNQGGTYYMNPTDPTWRASMAKMITVTIKNVLDTSTAVGTASESIASADGVASEAASSASTITAPSTSTEIASSASAGTASSASDASASGASSAIGAGASTQTVSAGTPGDSPSTSADAAQSGETGTPAADASAELPTVQAVPSAAGAA